MAGQSAALAVLVATALLWVTACAAAPVSLALFMFYPEAQRPQWSDGLGVLHALQRHGGFLVRRYNLMDSTGAFVRPKNGKHGHLRGLAQDALATFALDVVKGHAPDVVLVLDFGSYSSRHLGKSLAPDALWILEGGDDPQRFAWNADHARRYDVVITPDKPSMHAYRQLAEAKRRHQDFQWPHDIGPIAAEWLPHHAGLYDTDVDAWQRSEAYQQRFSTVATDDQGGHDTTGGDSSASVVTTCGRRLWLPAIAQHLDSGIVNWSTTVPGLPHHLQLASGRIVLNQAKYGEITRRIFEAMLAGAMVLTDRLHPHRGLEQLFVDGEDLVLYDSVEDAAAKVRYYLRNEHERAAIARSGHAKVLMYHTAQARVEQLYRLVRHHLRAGTAAYAHGDDGRVPTPQSRELGHHPDNDVCTTVRLVSASNATRACTVCRSHNPFVHAARHIARFTAQDADADELLTTDSILSFAQRVNRHLCNGDEWCRTAPTASLYQQTTTPPIALRGDATAGGRTIADIAAAQPQQQAPVHTSPVGQQPVLEPHPASVTRQTVPPAS